MEVTGNPNLLIAVDSNLPLDLADGRPKFFR